MPGGLNPQDAAAAQQPQVQNQQYKPPTDPNRANNGNNIVGNSIQQDQQNGVQVPGVYQQSPSTNYNPPAAAAAAPNPAAAPAPPTQPVNPLANLAPFNYDLSSVHPENDLDYNAFMRGFGFQSSQAQAAAAMKRAAIESGLQIQLPEIQRQEGMGINAVNNNAAARGAGLSSSRLQGVTNVQGAANYQGAAANQQAASGIADSNFDLANTQGSLQIQQAEQDLAARQRLLGIQNSQAAISRLLQAHPELQAEFQGMTQQ